MDLKDRTALLHLKPGAALHASKLRAAIKKAGYETRDFELVVEGRIEKRGEKFEIRPTGVAQAFVLLPAKQAETFAGKAARVRGKLVSESPEPGIEIIEISQPGE